MTAQSLVHLLWWHNDFDDDATFDVVAAVPEAGFVVASTAVDALGAGPRQVRAPPEMASSATPAHQRASVVTDWSTRHMVFAKPRTKADAARLQHHTRYQMQVARRNAPRFRKAAEVDGDSSLLNRFSHRGFDPSTRRSKADPLHRDWSEGLGGTGTLTAFTVTPTVGDNHIDECSQLTEVYNPTGGVGGTPVDLMFFSVRDNRIACGSTVASPTGGCLMSVDVTTGVFQFLRHSSRKIAARAESSSITSRIREPTPRHPASPSRHLDGRQAAQLPPGRALSPAAR